MTKPIYRKVNRYKCRLILESIKKMFQKKRLIIYLYKLDTHTGHKWNNKVDVLAKMEMGQEEAFELNVGKLANISYHYEWKQDLIDQPIKKMTKKQIKIKHMVELINLVCIIYL